MPKIKTMWLTPSQFEWINKHTPPSPPKPPKQLRPIPKLHTWIVMKCHQYRWIVFDSFDNKQCAELCANSLIDHKNTNQVAIIEVKGNSEP